VKFCGPEKKRRQRQLHLRFAAVGKTQTLTAKPSASPTDIKPQSLPTTGLFILVLKVENFDRYLSVCGKCGIQYIEIGAV